MQRNRNHRFPRPAELGRVVSWHRRKLAVLAAIAAVVVGVTAARPAEPPSAAVVRAVTALNPGETVQPGQLEVVRLPRAALPDDAVADPAEVVGRIVAGPVSRHGVVTTALLRSPRELTRPGRVVAPVRIGDAEVVALVSVGEVVDLVGTDPQSGQARVVAAAVRVVALPPPAADDQPQGAERETLILVEADRAVATALAGAASTLRISLLLRT